MKGFKGGYLTRNRTTNNYANYEKREKGISVLGNTADKLSLVVEIDTCRTKF